MIRQITGSANSFNEVCSFQINIFSALHSTAAVAASLAANELLVEVQRRSGDGFTFIAFYNYLLASPPVAPLVVRPLLEHDETRALQQKILARAQQGSRSSKGDRVQPPVVQTAVDLLAVARAFQEGDSTIPTSHQQPMPTASSQGQSSRSQDQQSRTESSFTSPSSSLVQSLAAALATSYDESFAVCEELLRSAVIDRPSHSSSHANVEAPKVEERINQQDATDGTQWMNELTMMRSLLVAAESPFIDVQLPSLRALLRLSCQPAQAARLFLAPLAHLLNSTTAIASTHTHTLTDGDIQSALQRGDGAWSPLAVLLRLLSDVSPDSAARAEPELARCAVSILVNLASVREHHAVLMTLAPLLQAALPWLTLATSRETKRQVQSDSLRVTVDCQCLRLVHIALTHYLFLILRNSGCSLVCSACRIAIGPHFAPVLGAFECARARIHP